MFTVSCYAFHPLVLQFVRIWRYTQVVSEVLTCILSMVCCQCMNMMLLSNRSSNESQFSVQRFKDDFVNHTNFGMVKEEGESPRTQYTVVDVHPEAKITSKAQTRCGEGWQFGISDQELQDKMEFAVQKHICSTRDLQTATSFWTHHLGDNIPGIHSTRKGVVKPSSNLYIK
ncbi:unnamed protein product [Arctia plantaginis]|uniref:Uncharacterized protein n=1 Tax=Arctia plantaginis TaxID=874455 RepID=A0A8S1BAU2_ARCPL|nr:unnamed protein product [Arctia plantaginis]CAB3254018.1 unnamed protein product [Arctia plantaginis]